MIDHVTINVKDVEKSKSFYEKVFAPLGYKISFGKEGTFWAFDIGNHALFEITQYNKEAPLTSVHIAFRMPTKEKVQEFYQAALNAGAKDNGAPGPRPQYTESYYACFVFDPSGHNIEAMWDDFEKKESLPQ